MKLNVHIFSLVNYFLSNNVNIIYENKNKYIVDWSKYE